MKRIILHDQMGFIPGRQIFFNIFKSISVTHDINKFKNKNHVIISINTEKLSDKVPHPFMIKTLQEVSIKGTHLNIIKDIYDKPTVNIILNGGKAESIFSKIRNKKWIPLLPLLFSIVLEVLAMTIRE